MSALPPKADMCSALGDVRFVPIADIARTYSITSSARASSVGGTLRPERLGGLEVDHQFEFGRGLHRQVSGLLAFKDAINVTSSLPVWINRVWPITDQATVGDVRAETDRLPAIDVGLRER